jgi:hypothetical protein
VANLTNEQRIIRQIIKAHGSVFDLEANPELFIEVVRKYAMDIADLANDPDGGLPGGVGPTSRLQDDGGLPGGVGPVGPTSFQTGPQLDDVMREVLKLQRQLAKISKQLGT